MKKPDFLLLFGYLPTEDELNAFCKVFTKTATICPMIFWK